MKWPSRLRPFLCCLTSLLVGSTALGQQDPRAVIVEPSTVVKTGGGRPSLAPGRHAPSTAKRYWADYAGKAIRRSNLDGSNVETVASEVAGPYGTSYDPETGHVLWTSSDDEVVEMAPADGSGPTVTLNSSFAENFALVVDGSEVDIAYGVVDGRVIKVTQYSNGESERRDVLLTLSSPNQVHGLALTPDNRALYLGDSSGRMTQKLNLSTLQVKPLVYDNATASASEPAARTPTTRSPAPASTSRTSSKKEKNP